jgi:bifunctional DNA primase/polymerase-like protein
VNLPAIVEQLALLGWRIYPSTRSRKGMFKGYVQAATSDLAVLDGWSRQYPGCNWSVIPRGSAIWALDVDTPSPDHAADGVAALRELCTKHGELPRCPHGRSGGGGHLLVFRDAGHPIRTKTGTPVPGIDPRAGHTPFTVAPSIHRRGGRYRWVVPPWECEPPIAPEWLLRQLEPPPPRHLPISPAPLPESRARNILARAVNSVLEAQPGQRNSALNRQAFTIGGLVGAGVIEESLAVTMLYRAGRYSGLDDLECRATIRSGFEAGRKHPLDARTSG